MRGVFICIATEQTSDCVVLHGDHLLLVWDQSEGLYIDSSSVFSVVDVYREDSHRAAIMLSRIG